MRRSDLLRQKRNRSVAAVLRRLASESNRRLSGVLHQRHERVWFAMEDDCCRVSTLMRAAWRIS